MCVQGLGEAGDWPPGSRESGLHPPHPQAAAVSDPPLDWTSLGPGRAPSRPAAVWVLVAATRARAWESQDHGFVTTAQLSAPSEGQEAWRVWVRGVSRTGRGEAWRGSCP